MVSTKTLCAPVLSIRSRDASSTAPIVAPVVSQINFCSKTTLAFEHFIKRWRHKHPKIQQSNQRHRLPLGRQQRLSGPQRQSNRRQMALDRRAQSGRRHGLQGRTAFRVGQRPARQPLQWGLRLCADERSVDERFWLQEQLGRQSTLRDWKETRSAVILVGV